MEMTSNATGAERRRRSEQVINARVFIVNFDVLILLPNTTRQFIFSAAFPDAFHFLSQSKNNAIKIITNFPTSRQRVRFLFSAAFSERFAFFITVQK
jgi:hypothetical protein